MKERPLLINDTASGVSNTTSRRLSVFRTQYLPLNRAAAFGCACGAVLCFYLAYLPDSYSPLRFCIIGYVACLVQLARLGTTRRCFYTGLFVGLVCVAPQLECFWNIFGAAALPLWLILAFWIALFTSIAHLAIVRLGLLRAAILVPFVWTGLEYFRSELYFLRFSWLNVGYAFANWPAPPFHTVGMYGLGFLVAAAAAFPLLLRPLASASTGAILLLVILLSPAPTLVNGKDQLRIAGVQLEFPTEQQIVSALNGVILKYPAADIVVLSEYTLDGPVPPSLNKWCENAHRYLVVGGKDPADDDHFYDTAFVIGPDGKLVFKQGKSVPIQFFKDGLPATHQALWKSPWGKIGICICYDLSYTRVTDRLVSMGAQALIVPTMDIADWGKREHQLHALVAPVRAAEYGIPIFRLASSGISQAIADDDRVVSEAPFPGPDETLFAILNLPERGSLPLDRPLAVCSVFITAVLVIVLSAFHFTSFRARKTVPAAKRAINAREPADVS